MERNEIFSALGHIIWICNQDKYSYHLSDVKKFPVTLITHGGMEFIYKANGEYDKQIELVKQFAKECQAAGLVAEVKQGATVREHGHHSGSWDVDAFAVIVRLPLPPAIEVLYGKKET